MVHLLVPALTMEAVTLWPGETGPLELPLHLVKAVSEAGGSSCSQQQPKRRIGQPERVNRPRTGSNLDPGRFARGARTAPEDTR